MSLIPLDTQQKLLELRLDNDESIIDGWERHLEDKFEKLFKIHKCLDKIVKPIYHLQQEAESEGKMLNALEAQRLANDPAWYRQLAFDCITANSDEVQINEYSVTPQKIRALIIAAGNLVNGCWPDPLFDDEEKELNEALDAVGYVTKYTFHRRKEQNDERSVATDPQ